MSVFTKQAFTMSAMPTPSNSVPASKAPSRRSSFAYPESSGAMTPAADPHIVTINVESVLFDMDGTLINSSPAVVKAWEMFAKDYPLDLEDILRCKFSPRRRERDEMRLDKSEISTNRADSQPPTVCGPSTC